MAASATCRSTSASSPLPIATSNAPCVEGTFRQDLYYRLAIISIFLPPLRERRDDILPMVEFFIDRYNRKFRKNVRGITEETRKLLMNHNWPGNVRELKNAIERAMILEEEEFLRPTYMPFAVGKRPGRPAPPSSTSPAPGRIRRTNHSTADAAFLR